MATTSAPLLSTGPAGAASSNYYMLAAAGGLIILHASQVQPKNTSSVLIANLLSIAFATIAYWACGFAFAVGNLVDGSASNFFLSHTRFFLIDATEGEYDEFAKNVIVLTLVIVIVNSGFIARLRCWIYPLIIVLIGGFLYPCVHHWVYHKSGWLRAGIIVTHGETGKAVKRTLIYMDEGGSGTIHIFGGTCALIGTIIIGTRKDRKDKKFAALGGNLNPLIVVGGILALVGLVAKNSSLTTEYPADHVDASRARKSLESLALINNLLSAQASAIIAFTLKRTKLCGDPSGTKALINGALAGVVGVSCAPHQYHPYAGLVIGVITGLAYVAWTSLFHVCRIDDPTDSAAVHLGGGIWAALAGPIFRQDTGIIYTGGTNWRFETFGWQLLGVLAIFVWAGLTLFIIFVPFLIARIATYKETDIQQGLDVFELDDPAFPDKSQYSHDYDTDNMLDDIIPSSLPRTIGYDTKGYENPAVIATSQHIWEQPEQDWRLAQY